MLRRVLPLVCIARLVHLGLTRIRRVESAIPTIAGLVTVCPYPQFLRQQGRPPILGSPRLAHKPYYAKTRAPTICWVARTLSTLPCVLECLGSFYMCNALSKASSSFSSEEYPHRFSNIVGCRFHKSRPWVGFLFKFFNCFIFAFGGWLYFSLISLRWFCVLRQLGLMLPKYISA